jgi:predicted acylesterase/phospholipase RssA
MNAFCIETGVMEEFDKHQITKDHFRAALAFPFVYPPAELDTKHYYEGSALDPLNLPNLARRIARGDIEGSSHTIVLIDVLGALEQALIRQPRHLIDAYGISIITPVVSLAQTKLEYFKYRYLPDLERTKNVELIELSFKIEKRRRDTLTDWSRSNLEELFDIGRDAGKEFCRVYGDKLPRRAPDSADPIDTDTAERQRPAESQ